MYGNCSRCIAGYYSNTCREECPANCTDGLCTMDTGICYACVPGYHGNKCSEKCGHCKGGSCDKDTGKCMTLCEDGYAGDKCDVEVIYRYISRTGNSCGHTTLSVGLGCGVAILALLLVIIVQAKRKHSQRQTDDCPIANVGLKDIEKFLQPETVDIQDVLVPL
ncbi:scavenger receptor class F member 1-like [Ylistrum balloti]|uniref:scavenger receptor class F member 1-like n=1 Tax=Ylistrum balloti TaxID=509963 RepID=UPI002905E624|nr:scavenger receptor class F member 1-like [Ylistrum balloti]